MSLASALARRAVLAGLLLMPAGWAVAGESRPFTPQALAAAKASGKPVQIVGLGAKDSDIVNMAALASFNIGG